jgi:hypothetical protein
VTYGLLGRRTLLRASPVSTKNEMPECSTGQGGQFMKAGPLGQKANSLEQPIWSDGCRPQETAWLAGRSDGAKAMHCGYSLVKPLPKSAANWTKDFHLTTHKAVCKMGFCFPWPLSALVLWYTCSQEPLVMGRSQNFPGHFYSTQPRTT